MPFFKTTFTEPVLNFSLCSARYLGEFYFKMDRLRWSGTNQQSLSGFEKIRTVGKGVKFVSFMLLLMLCVYVCMHTCMHTHTCAQLL